MTSVSDNVASLVGYKSGDEDGCLLVVLKGVVLKAVGFYRVYDIVLFCRYVERGV